MPVTSQSASREASLFDRLPEGIEVPQFRIYNALSDDLLSAFSPANGWHIVVDEGAIASASFRDGVVKVDVKDGGRTWYAIQLCLVPLPMTAGYWSVSFDCRSDRPRRLMLDIAHVGDDWFALAGRPTFRMTPEWTSHAFAFFNERRVEPMARFEFNLGGESVGAEFRNLRIIREE